MSLLTEGLLILAILNLDFQVGTSASINYKDDSNKVNEKVIVYESEEFNNLSTKDKINLLLDLLQKHITIYQDEIIKSELKPIVSQLDEENSQEDKNETIEISKNLVESISKISVTGLPKKPENVLVSSELIDFYEHNTTNKDFDDYVSSETTINSAELDEILTSGPNIDILYSNKKILENPEHITSVTTESFKPTSISDSIRTQESQHMSESTSNDPIAKLDNISKDQDLLNLITTSTGKNDLTTNMETNEISDLLQSSFENVESRANSAAHESSPIKESNLIDVITDSTESLNDLVPHVLAAETNIITESTDIVRNEAPDSPSTTELYDSVTEPYLLETFTKETTTSENSVHLKDHVVDIPTELTPQLDENILDISTGSTSLSPIKTESTNLTIKVSVIESTTPISENSVGLETENNDKNDGNESLDRMLEFVLEESNDNNSTNPTLTTPPTPITKSILLKEIILSAEDNLDNIAATTKPIDINEPMAKFPEIAIPEHTSKKSEDSLKRSDNEPNSITIMQLDSLKTNLTRWMLSNNELNEVSMSESHKLKALIMLLFS